MPEQLIQPPQPQFPFVNVNITAEGMLISIVLAPGLSINQAIAEQTMNDICKKWLQTRKELRDQMETIRAVQNSKIN